MADDGNKLEQSTKPATKGFVSTMLTRFARGSGAAVKAAMAKRLDPLQENVRGLVQRADDQAGKLDSLERRASRHADHLGRLEDRVRKLEGK